jgi:hypothetical protein
MVTVISQSSGPSVIAPAPMYANHLFMVVELGPTEDEADLDDWIVQEQKNGAKLMRRPVQIGSTNRYRVLIE